MVKSWKLLRAPDMDASVPALRSDRPKFTGCVAQGKTSSTDGSGSFIIRCLMRRRRTALLALVLVVAVGVGVALASDEGPAPVPTIEDCVRGWNDDSFARGVA